MRNHVRRLPVHLWQFLFWHSFWHIFDLSGIFFDLLSYIFSDILSDIFLDILFDILSDISSDLLSDIFSDIDWPTLIWQVGNKNATPKESKNTNEKSIQRRQNSAKKKKTAGPNPKHQRKGCQKQCHMETPEHAKDDQELKKNRNLVEKPRLNIKCQKNAAQRTQITGKWWKYTKIIGTYREISSIQLEKSQKNNLAPNFEVHFHGQVWQFNGDFGCYRGVPYVCMRSLVSCWHWVNCWWSLGVGILDDFVFQGTFCRWKPGGAIAWCNRWCPVLVWRDPGLCHSKLSLRYLYIHTWGLVYWHWVHT